MASTTSSTALPLEGETSVPIFLNPSNDPFTNAPFLCVFGGNGVLWHREQQLLAGTPSPAINNVMHKDEEVVAEKYVRVFFRPHLAEFFYHLQHVRGMTLGIFSSMQESNLAETVSLMLSSPSFLALPKPVTFAFLMNQSFCQLADAFAQQPTRKDMCAVWNSQSGNPDGPSPAWNATNSAIVEDSLDTVLYHAANAVVIQTYHPLASPLIVGPSAMETIETIEKKEVANSASSGLPVLLVEIEQAILMLQKNLTAKADGGFKQALYQFEESNCPSCWRWKCMQALSLQANVDASNTYVRKLEEDCAARCQQLEESFNNLRQKLVTTEEQLRTCEQTLQLRDQQNQALMTIQNTLNQQQQQQQQQQQPPLYLHQYLQQQVHQQQQHQFVQNFSPLPTSPFVGEYPLQR